MRKSIEKILAASSAVIAIVLLIILLVTAFGGIGLDEFENTLVRGLFVTLSIAYFLLIALLLILMFTTSDAVKEIILRSENGGVAKTTLGVVRKMVKQECKKIEGVKCGKITLISNEYGARLKVSVKIKDRDAAETEILIRTTLEELFLGALSYRFNTIEIKVIALQARFVPDKGKVDSLVEERLAARNEKTLAEAEKDGETDGQADIEVNSMVEEAYSVPETVAADVYEAEAETLGYEDDGADDALPAEDE